MTELPFPKPIFQMVRAAKINGRVKALQALKHNLREIPAELYSREKIDHELSHMNKILVGEASSHLCMKFIEKTIEDHEIKKLRKDAVYLIEVIVSLPSDHNIDDESFFIDAVEWSKNFYTNHVINAVIHRDQTRPHCHILILPLQQGKMIGSKLMGYRGRLRQIQESFHEQVGKKYSLCKPITPYRYPHEYRQKMAHKAIQLLTTNVDLLQDMNVVNALTLLAYQNPEPLMTACERMND